MTAVVVAQPRRGVMETRQHGREKALYTDRLVRRHDGASKVVIRRGQRRVVCSVGLGVDRDDFLQELDGLSDLALVNSGTDKKRPRTSTTARSDCELTA